MSLRFIPSTKQATEVASLHGAPSAPGVPDQIRIMHNKTSTISFGGAPVKSDVTTGILTNDKAPVSVHPLEARLLKWQDTQKAFRLEKMSRMYGAAEPIRREMESFIVGLGEWKPAQLGGSARLHGDILDGKEMSVEWEDIYRDDIVNNAPDIHSEFEKRLGMNW